MNKNIMLWNLPTWDKGLFIDILAGLALWLVFFALYSLSNGAITIGVPQAFFATETAKFFGTVILAPVAEELFFRVVLVFALLTLVDVIFKKESVERIVGYIAVIMFSSLAFALYHIQAYAGGLSIANIQATFGLFLGAFLFGTFASLIVLWRKNPIGTTIGHALTNLTVYLSLAVILI